MPEPLHVISITTHPESDARVSELLEEQFQVGSAVYRDLATGFATVSVYVPRLVEDPRVVRARLRAALGELIQRGHNLQPARISIRRVPPRDWSESWRRHFKPIDIDGRLLVKPTWSRRRPKARQALVVLDPGLSFGTGQHATTKFCLEQLVKLRRPNQPQSLLDAGTGSGILAIAAAKLGYSPVHAFDYDPASVRIAAENCRLNEVSSIDLSEADLTRLPRRRGLKFDVVCANLMADLLIAERDRLLARVKAGGALVLAGILDSQFAEVERAFAAAGVRLVKSRTEGEWRSGLFRIS